jgi:hypothetical protein
MLRDTQFDHEFICLFILAPACERRGLLGAELERTNILEVRVGSDLQRNMMYIPSPTRHDMQVVYLQLNDKAGACVLDLPV